MPSVSAAEGSLIDLLQRGAAYLAERDVPHARRDCEWLFCHVLGMERIELYTRHDMPIATAERGRLRHLLQRRARREPLAYLLGEQPFCSISLLVSPAVLVPRPETEELVQHALRDLPERAGARVLDVGTGSGAIALALKYVRVDADVHAVERSEAALAVARANAERLNLSVQFHHGDLAAALPGAWDLLIANLPYVAEGERELCDPELAFEPAEALFAADDGLAVIAALLADAPRLLGDSAVLWLEHGHAQGTAVRALCGEQGLQAESRCDLAGQGRFTRVWR